MSLSIVLSTPPTFHLSSWSIRRFTNSDVSHSSIHTVGRGLLKGKPLVWEATGKRGVSIVHGDRWTETNKVLYKFTCTDEAVADRILDYAADQLGKPFDKPGLARFAVHILLLPWLPQAAALFAIDSAKAMFCSEFVTRALFHAGVKFTDQEPDLVSPNDLKVIRRLEMFEVEYANPASP